MHPTTRTRVVLVGAALTLASALAATRSAAQAPATRTVVTAVRLAIPPEEGIRAFLDDDAMRAWWKTTRTLVERRPGGVWAVAWDGYFDDERNFFWSGVIEQIEADRLVITALVQFEPDRPILFGPMRLEISAAPDAGGSVLTVRHGGYQSGEEWDRQYDEVVAGWKAVLSRLEAWSRE